MRYDQIADIYNITQYILYLNTKGESIRQVIQERLRLKKIDKVFLIFILEIKKIVWGYSN